MILIVSWLLAVAIAAGDEPFVRVGSTVPMPERIRYVEPSYPIDAGRARIMGLVILEVGLDEEGRPIEIKVLYGLPLLDRAAIEAVRQWRYERTILEGKAQRVLFREVIDLFPNAGARVEYLAALVRNKEEQKGLRVIAAERLRAIARRDKSVLKALRQARDDPDPDVSAAATRALLILDPPGNGRR